MAKKKGPPRDILKRLMKFARVEFKEKRLKTVELRQVKSKTIFKRGTFLPNLTIRVNIETEDGEDILTFSPAEAYQSVVFCSPELENGETYIAYTGGSSTGTVTDGLYSGGIYTAGAKVASFTISSAVTTIGSFGGGSPGGGRR